MATAKKRTKKRTTKKRTTKKGATKKKGRSVALRLGALERTVKSHGAKLKEHDRQLAGVINVLEGELKGAAAPLRRLRSKGKR